MDETMKERMRVFQRNEITEHHIYKNLAAIAKSEKNREVLTRIAEDELRHYAFWKSHTGTDVPPDGFAIWKYSWIARVFGLTFGAKLMEQGEERAQDAYRNVVELVPEAEMIAKDEDRHEEELLGTMDDVFLKYVSSIVLGLNDALVELTGALAGFTFALQNTDLIAMAGLITGVAASLSMAASEYLSTKAETNHDRHPVKAAVYTGIAYLCVVTLLVAPFLIFESPFTAIAGTLVSALVIIVAFSFYASVALGGMSFRHRVLEMGLLSFGVAAISFGIGVAMRNVLGVEL